MTSANPYPVFLALNEHKCVVVGLGGVGCRKLAGLLASRAQNVLALDLRPKAELSIEAAQLLKDARIKFENRCFTKEDASSSFLVFAATYDCEENLRIAQLCRETRTLCNCITDPAAGSFILPATARKGNLCAALSTAGQSPYLASQWRLELEDWLRPREKMAWLMGRIRAPLLALGNEHSHNSAIFRKIAESPIPHWLEHDDLLHCEEWLKTELPPELHQELALIFAEYAHAFA